MLPGEQVDGEVERGVDDHEELHGGCDEHVPERGVVHAPVTACQDAADVRRLVHTGHQSVQCHDINTVMLVACPGPRDWPLKILISSGDARQTLINSGLICIFAFYEFLGRRSFKWDQSCNVKCEHMS